MKTKIIYLLIALVPILWSCDDYLDVKSNSQLQPEFVFGSDVEAEKAMLGAYGAFQNYGSIHSNFLFYEVIAVGSDIELGPENPVSGGGRYIINYLYPGNSLVGVNSVVNKNDNIDNGQWNSLYHIINLCNNIIEGLDNSPFFQSIDKTAPSKATTIYGEALALRATLYYELTRMWGEVPYITKPMRSKKDYEGVGATSRDVIQESEIEALRKAEPLMYYLGQGGYNAERMTRGYVQGLIGRLALVRGGYSLRPAGYEPQSGDNVIQSDGTWGKMVRRGDYKTYYEVAREYLEKCRDNSGASLITKDDRTSPNPFQLVFQKMMDLEVSQEAIYEVAQTSGIQNERPYAFGRPSAVSSNTGFPGKAYGQMRFYPTFYYGDFNPKDLRRDVTVAVTANSGTGSEMMISFQKGSTAKGGIALNKWDQSRMKNPAAATSRQTGINAPYMRYADILLLLAETYQVLGNDPAAQAELLKVRQRAFDPADPDYANLVTNYVGSKTGDALLEAIQDERKLELAGEGARRFDLVRWGILGEKINELQLQMQNIVTSLETSGSYTFPNGNVISNYIWTKSVKWADTKLIGLTNMLTENCDVSETSQLYPFKFPGWRGNYGGWTGGKYVGADNCTNLAIQGLFKPLTTSEIATLEGQGYKKTSWAVDIVDQKDSWIPQEKGLFGGYLPSDYSAGKPPRYILPLPASEISRSKGTLHNEYGFPDAY
ncbi:MAG: RagB/SusD family nutrient uptake outer membrane protein [Dysgonomonas sp.]